MASLLLQVKPLWGMSSTPMQRIAVPPDYADGFGKPRVAKSGKPLPSPRLLTQE